jgi:hypothetical protein
MQSIKQLSKDIEQTQKTLLNYKASFCGHQSFLRHFIQRNKSLLVLSIPFALLIVRRVDSSISLKKTLRPLWNFSLLLLKFSGKRIAALGFK